MTRMERWAIPELTEAIEETEGLTTEEAEGTEATQ